MGSITLLGCGAVIAAVGNSADFNFVTDSYSINGVATSGFAAAVAAAKATYSRTSTKFYTDSTGAMTSIGSGTLARGDVGALIEPSRTNVALQSQTFDSATWTKTASSVTADAATAPDGTSTADQETADGTTAAHFVNQSGIVLTATQYSWTVYAKANTASFIHLVVTGVNLYVQFNLSTGALVFSAAGTGTLTSTSAVAVANGFWRFNVVFTQSSGSTQNTRIYVLSTSSNVVSPSQTTSVSQYLWGDQPEAGATATSYIPTTTASVTRVADAMVILIADGTYTATVTFDDNSTQTLTSQVVAGGTGWAVPTNLTRPNVKRIQLS